jgi:hypothetical protein
MKIRVTSQFDKKRRKLLTEEAYAEFITYIDLYPTSGDIIAGAGGVRIFRTHTGKNNRGKSGGARILYYYQVGELVLLIDIYTKSEKENITPAERNEIKKRLPMLLALYGESHE